MTQQSERAWVRKKMEREEKREKDLAPIKWLLRIIVKWLLPAALSLLLQHFFGS
ncbi:MAG: hypothetical protein KGJ13_05760 [Patescibacteria group bacterium]|nr:hypothetical protein [Patescibacteria group bacterium]